MRELKASVDTSAASEFTMRPQFAPLSIRRARLGHEVHDFLTPTEALIRLCRVSREEDIGIRRLPVSALSLKTGEESPYNAFFTRELLVAALMLEDIHPQLLRSTIRFSAENQGVRYWIHREEQPGRIPHEIRKPTDKRAKEISRKQGWDWPYYGSVDATPLFVLAIRKQTNREGIGFLTEVYTGRDGAHTYEYSLNSALDWIKRRLDSNEGLLAFKPLFVGSLENQAWKDSWDSYHHADGTLANGGDHGIASQSASAAPLYIDPDMVH